MRGKIFTFHQGQREPFKDAWARFKDLQLECPQLINFFYGGVNLRYQTTLDTYSEGNFNTRSPTDVIWQMENVATIRAFKKTNDELSEIKEILDSLPSLLTDQNKSRVFEIEDDNPMNLEGRR